MTRRELRALNIVRAMSIAIPACVIAVVGLVALSPFEPLGLARKLEFDISVRVDDAVLASTVAAVLILFALAGAVTPVESRRHQRARVRTGTSRLSPARLGLGPVAVTGATVARGRSSRAAIAVTAIAVAAAVAAGGLVASFDRLLAQPQRYGASWDIVVGYYSQPGPLAAGVSKLPREPGSCRGRGLLRADRLGQGRRTRCGPAGLAGLHRPPTSRDGDRPRSEQ